ncbi:MAG: hypothetical protein HY744_34755 [Deltaproteobacteria bacterium]|nr:hypothetical protein [Deltaproteobacteria bacterium]
MTTGDAGSCPGCITAPADAAQIAGDYLFALSAYLDPSNPVLFAAKVTAAPGSGGAIELGLHLEALAAADRKTVVGNEPEDFGPFTAGADGCFDGELGHVAVAGAANPISGSNLVVEEAVLHGALCAPGDFHCGTVTGKVTEPIPVDLSSKGGSHFTLQRLDEPGKYPEPPYINCEKDEAKPLEK